jgi:S1-C subfamily serine protease
MAKSALFFTPKMDFKIFFVAAVLGVIFGILIFIGQKNNIIKTSPPKLNQAEVGEKKLIKNYLGVQFMFINKRAAQFNNIPEGAYIQEVIESSPAHKAGFQKGDIILQINGEKIDSENKIAEILNQSDQGVPITVVLQRAGEEKIYYLQSN